MPKQDLILLALNPSPILDLMERALLGAGFGLGIVHNRSEMNRAFQETVPALLIIDEKFVDLDGFSISTEILGRFPSLPIILYAERDTTGLAEFVLRLGLSGYLYPPLKVEDIVDEVQRSLARARQLGDWLRREVRRTTSSLAEKVDLSESERHKLEAIIANIQDGIVVMDNHKNIILLNRTVRDIFNLGNKDITGKSLADVISNADFNALLARASDGPLKYHEINFDDGRVLMRNILPSPGLAGL